MALFAYLNRKIGTHKDKIHSNHSYLFSYSHIIVSHCNYLTSVTIYIIQNAIIDFYINKQGTLEYEVINHFFWIIFNVQRVSIRNLLGRTALCS